MVRLLRYHKTRKAKSPQLLDPLKEVPHLASQAPILELASQDFQVLMKTASNKRKE